AEHAGPGALVLQRGPERLGGSAGRGDGLEEPHVHGAAPPLLPLRARGQGRLEAGAVAGTRLAQSKDQVAHEPEDGLRRLDPRSAGSRDGRRGDERGMKSLRTLLPVLLVLATAAGCGRSEPTSPDADATGSGVRSPLFAFAIVHGSQATSFGGSRAM